MTRWWLGVLGLLLLACAPQTTSQVGVGSVGFYPLQTGLEWVYRPQGGRATDPPFRLSVLGAASFEGKPAIRLVFSGQGRESYYYRSLGPEGVRLLGYEQRNTESRVVYDPPLLEYPPEALLRPGYRWGGTTRITLTQLGRPFYQEAVDYTYTVVEEIDRVVAAGSFRVLRILLELRGSQSGLVQREVWFAPRVGEVRTNDGLLLVERSFR